MSDLLKATLEWKLVGPDEWEYTNTLLLKPVAKVTYLQPNEREAKNFKWSATVSDKEYFFRTIGGAKRFVENWCIQKGKVE